MNQSEALAFLHSQYAENMWMSTRWYEEATKRIIEKTTREEIDEEQLRNAIQSASTEQKEQFERPFRRGYQFSHYYSCPKCVFLAGSQDDIVIVPRYSCQRLTGSFRVEISSLYNYEYVVGEQYKPFTAEVTAENNRIVIPYYFDTEDQYFVKVFIKLSDNSEAVMLSTCIYTIDQDIYSLNYYKADFHMHTTYSDGYEEPELTAFDARRVGMDIIAITDHNHIEGSIKARKIINETGSNMTVILGEEYSLEYSPMHILSYGLETGIDRRYLTRQIENSDEVAKYASDSIQCDSIAYACTQALLEKVHELGGISVLAHPYWKPPIRANGRLDTPEQLFLDLSKRRNFDGVELVSGSPYGNCSTSALQHHLVREMVGDLDGIPVIGITDTHTHSIDPISGKHFTVVFAKTMCEQDVLSALRKGLCVAVETNDTDSIVYGTLRLSKFTHFLLSYYFPTRDMIAELEGLQLLKRLVNLEIVNSFID